MNFSKILEQRRAINFFDSGRDVSEELLHKVIGDATMAPSSFNLQPWKLIVLRDQGKKAALRSLAFDQPKITDAPVVLIVLADRDGWKEKNPTLEALFSKTMEPEQRDWFINTTKALYGNSPEAQQAFANKNAGLFAMSLMYAATASGLHTHPMDGFDHEGVREEFNIPEHYWIPMLIAVGFKKEDVEIAPKGWRASVEDIIVETL